MGHEDNSQILIDILVDKVRDLQEELNDMTQSRSRWINRYMELNNELARLKDKTTQKRGRPPKKRGPGRPKGSKNKAQAGLKMVLKGGVRK